MDRRGGSGPLDERGGVNAAGEVTPACSPTTPEGAALPQHAARSTQHPIEPPRDPEFRTQDLRVRHFGTLYGIGVGPGDPELITVKGLRLLQAVPVVFVPVARSGGASYARAIVEAYLDTERQRVETLLFSMRDEDDARRGRWRANAARLLETLATGVDAVFLTEGDPMLYSTFVHVAGALRDLEPTVPIVAVPGVSSAFAAASAAFVPLADRDERLAVLPATYADQTLDEVLDTFDTIVLLKVASVFDRVLSLLDARGLTEHAVWVRRCGRPEQEIVRDIRTLRGRKLDYFSLLIVRRPG